MGIDRSGADVTACRWCGAFHDGICPRVRAVEFDETGSVMIRVEFFSAAELAPPQRSEDDYPKKGGQ